MSKKPKISYQERVRLALEGMHAKIASDPTEPEDHRYGARSALTAPSPTEILAYVTEQAGDNRIHALRALRAFITGEPVVTHELLIAPTAPSADAPTAPSADQDDEQDEQTAPSADEQTAPSADEPTAPSKQPAKYSQSLPVKRVITSGKYLDSPEEQASMRRADVKKLK